MACTILASPPSTRKPMIENLDSQAVGTPGTTRLRWGGQRLTGLGTSVGIGLFFWGLYEPMNGLLIVLGTCVTALSLYLRNRTQFGRPGRPIVEEEFVRAPDGSYKNYKFRLKLTKLEILFYVAGFSLLLLGLRGSTNWYVIAAGILLTWITQLYGNSLWFGSSTIGFSDSLSPAYERLKRIGDEVRGEGFVVRRVENGLRYSEGSRSLTFRSGWAFVEKQRMQAADGSMKDGDRLLVNISDVGYF
jgi:hypothetical protein